MQIFSIPLSQFGDSINTRAFQKITVLCTDSLNTGKIRTVTQCRIIFSSMDVFSASSWRAFFSAQAVKKASTEVMPASARFLALCSSTPLISDILAIFYSPLLLKQYLLKLVQADSPVSTVHNIVHIKIKKVNKRKGFSLSTRVNPFSVSKYCIRNTGLIN